jgi:transcriptional regulator with XRE-family HTH domain
MSTTETTAENLKAIRDERDLTQDDVAAILGIPRNAVSKIETGTRALSDAEKKILDWYFFGIIPPRLTNTDGDLSGVLDFEEAEWKIIGHIARRHGLTEGQWIAQRVRDYLAHLEVRSAAEDDKPITGELIPFPSVPLVRAAAGVPILADAEHVEPDRDLGEGRFLLELRGDSMEPRFHNKQRVVLRDKASLKRPVLKYGELYCFVHEGAATFKQWAKDESGRKVLRSLNPEHADIPADEDTDWIGWMDEKDNIARP